MADTPVFIVDADQFVQWVADLEYGLALAAADDNPGRLRMGVEHVLSEMKKNRAWRRDAQGESDG